MSGDRAHAKVPGSEASENGYLGACWCQHRGDAWPCASSAARDGDNDELRDEIRDELSGWPLGGGYYHIGRAWGLGDALMDIRRALDGEPT